MNRPAPITADRLNAAADRVMAIYAGQSTRKLLIHPIRAISTTINAGTIVAADNYISGQPMGIPLQVFSGERFVGFRSLQFGAADFSGGGVYLIREIPHGTPAANTVANSTQDVFVPPGVWEWHEHTFTPVTVTGDSAYWFHFVPTSTARFGGAFIMLDKP